MMGGKLIGLCIFTFLFFMSVVMPEAMTKICNLNVSLVNQDPNPAIPGGYVDVLFQVNGVENVDCDGARFQLIPYYPLSLDYQDIKILDGSTWTPSSNNVWNIPYSLRVDKDAFDGNAELDVHYSPNNLNSDLFSIKKFSIPIKDTRTDFDAVIQATTTSEVTIAIANIGKYPANSIRIPEQENFQVIGTDGQMVGNLESGDYTIVSFSILPRNQEKQLLKFDIYYTDAIGERRILNKELLLSITNTSDSSEDIYKKSPSLFTSFNILILLILLLIIYIIYKKYFSKK